MYTSPTPLRAGLLGRCPRCGKGKLFSGVMNIVEHCAVCTLSLRGQDSGDGPVFFVLIIVGFLSVGLAAFMELKFSPPLWMHAIVSIPFTLIACVLWLRFFKAWLIAKQYKNQPDSFM